MADAEASQLQLKLDQQNIKERLNLHVKRRLQQDGADPASLENSELLADSSRAANLRRGKAKETPKQRKPYQKRTDKTKTEASKVKKGNQQMGSPATEANETLDDQELEGHSPEAGDGKSSSRDRYKNADILNMVLSAKKRALMQDPEVQAFWAKIMQAIKS
ncbi:hypothetical protein KR018_003062 [Drosophila ironensis]|nr:hypothetical protein KR018_003062 [Drosophila ironensis]